MPTPPPTYTTHPTPLALFRLVFEAAAQVLADLLHHFRKRSISQTCHACAKAARCLFELARLELTLRFAPERFTPYQATQLSPVLRQFQHLTGQTYDAQAFFPEAFQQLCEAAPLGAQTPSALTENATPLGARTPSSANDPLSHSPSALTENATPLGPRTSSSATPPTTANPQPPSPHQSPSPSPSQSQSQSSLNPQSSICNPQSNIPQSDAPSVHPVHSVHNVHSVHSPRFPQSSSAPHSAFRIPNSAFDIPHSALPHPLYPVRRIPPVTQVHNAYPGDELLPSEVLSANQAAESYAVVQFVPPFRLHRRHPGTASAPAPGTAPFPPACPPQARRSLSSWDLPGASPSGNSGSSFHPLTPGTLPAGFSSALLAHLQSALANPQFTFAQLTAAFTGKALLRSPGRTLARVLQDLYILARALNIPLPTQSPSPSPVQSEFELSPSQSEILNLKSEIPVSPSPSPSQSSGNPQSSIHNPQSGIPQSDAPFVHSVHDVHGVHSVHSSNPNLQSAIYNPQSDAPP